MSLDSRFDITNGNNNVITYRHKYLFVRCEANMNYRFGYCSYEWYYGIRTSERTIQELKQRHPVKVSDEELSLYTLKYSMIES